MKVWAENIEEQRKLAERFDAAAEAYHAEIRAREEQQREVSRRNRERREEQDRLLAKDTIQKVRDLGSLAAWAVDAKIVKVERLPFGGTFLSLLHPSNTERMIVARERLIAKPGTVQSAVETYKKIFREKWQFEAKTQRRNYHGMLLHPETGLQSFDIGEFKARPAAALRDHAKKRVDEWLERIDPDGAFFSADDRRLLEQYVIQDSLVEPHLVFNLSRWYMGKVRDDAISHGL